MYHILHDYDLHYSSITSFLGLFFMKFHGDFWLEPLMLGLMTCNFPGLFTNRGLLKLGIR